jgi:hypothetical protein
VPEGEFVQVTTGETQSCAITVDGEIVCWGCEFDEMEVDHGECDVPEV